VLEKACSIDMYQYGGGAKVVKSESGDGVKITNKNSQGGKKNWLKQV